MDFLNFFSFTFPIWALGFSCLFQPPTPCLAHLKTILGVARWARRLVVIEKTSKIMSPSVASHRLPGLLDVTTATLGLIRFPWIFLQTSHHWPLGFILVSLPFSSFLFFFLLEKKKRKGKRRGKTRNPKKGHVMETSHTFCLFLQAQHL